MKHCNLVDYQIIQRNDNGYASVPFEGYSNDKLPQNARIFVRVLREDDYLPVISWTECQVCEEETGCRWNATLTVPQGGLYRFEAVEQQSPDSNLVWCPRIASASHVGIGDIYVMAGQSNMTGYGRDFAYDPPELGVHCFNRQANWCIAAHPLGDSFDSPYGYSEYSSGTSPALSFARRIRKITGVPVALIPAAVGGSPLRSWNTEEDGQLSQKMDDMIRDAGGKFKGFLWFQGCSDCSPELSSNYYERFIKTIAQWRAHYGMKPVLVVQLNRWAGGLYGEADREWGLVRDAFRRAAIEQENVFTIPSLDMPMSDGIHNSSGANVIIGERLANAAAYCIYHLPGCEPVNILSAHRIDETHICLNITPGHNVLTLAGRGEGMEIEDETGLCKCIHSSTSGDTILVETERSFTLPAKFHYSWHTVTVPFAAADVGALPLNACYGVDIEEN